MINMLIGPSGGGKSYEAVVHQILSALRQGRKVITNMPLNVEAICALLGEHCRDLIELRKEHREDSKLRPFSTVSEFGDPWRHPKHGYGPLYVIDECQEQFPRRLPGTPVEIEEYFAKHRHEVTDFLLITQSYGKISKAICDNVQILYKVRKAVAFGEADHYYRKVIDGIGGGEMDVQKRAYEKKYFQLYKSHTKNFGQAQEADASDIRPRYKMYYRIALFGMIPVAALLVYSVTHVDQRLVPSAKPKAQAHAEHGERTQEHATRRSAPAPSSPAFVGTAAPPAASAPSADKKSQESEPFGGMGIHIIGNVRVKAKSYYLMALSINGVPTRTISTPELEEAGYKVEKVSDCAARLSYHDNDSVFIRCDMPAASIQVGDPAKVTRSSPEAAQAAPPDAGSTSTL